MTRPPFRVRLLGHPVIVFPTAGLLLFSLYLLTQDMRGWPLCLIFGLTMHKVMEANKQLARYHSWQRAWDSMSGDAPRERRSGRKLLGVLLAIGGIIGTATLLGDSEQAPVAMGVAIVLGGPVLALVALVKLWRWSRPPPPSSGRQGGLRHRLRDPASHGGARPAHRLSHPAGLCPAGDGEGAMTGNAQSPIAPFRVVQPGRSTRFDAVNRPISRH